MYHQDWSSSNRQLNENAFVMPEFTCDIGTKKGKDRLLNIERRQTYYAHRV